MQPNAQTDHVHLLKTAVSALQVVIQALSETIEVVSPAVVNAEEVQLLKQCEQHLRNYQQLYYEYTDPLLFRRCISNEYSLVYETLDKLTECRTKIVPYDAITEANRRANEEVFGGEHTTDALVPQLTLEAARGMAARAWCLPETSTRIMDPCLAEAFAQIILREVNPMLTAANAKATEELEACKYELQLLRERD